MTDVSSGGASSNTAFFDNGHSSLAAIVSFGLSGIGDNEDVPSFSNQ